MTDVEPQRPRRSRRAVRPGAEQAAIDGAGLDSAPEGWGDPIASEAADANDEQLRRDVPPHY